MSPTPGFPWQNELSKMWQLGMTGNQAYRFLRELDIAPRKQTFFNAWRETAGYEKNQYLARLQPESKAPDAAYVNPSERYVAERYTYRFEADLLDVSTGTYSRGFLHWAGWDLVSIEQARAELNEAIAILPAPKCEGARLGSFVGAYSRNVP